MLGSHLYSGKHYAIGVSQLIPYGSPPMLSDYEKEKLISRWKLGEEAIFISLLRKDKIAS